MELAKVTPKGLGRIFEKAFARKKPIMIVGQPGIGKSQIVEQVTSKMGYKLITMYPAISDPTDFKGMPVYDKETGTARFVPFGTLIDLVNATEPTICLIDDLGQANMSVMAATMHLFEARMVGEHKISDQVCFVVCTNDKTHHAGVSGIIEPVKSRMTSILHLEPNIEDWIEYAIQSGIRPEVIGFIRLRGLKMLAQFEPTMDLTNSPSPRGNNSVSDILDLELDDRDLEFAMIQGACGHGYAVEFVGFKKLFESLADPRAILKDPDSVVIPERDDSVIYAYCSALSRLAKPEHMDAIVKFARRIPTIYQVKLLMYDCKYADPENHSTGAFTQWSLENQEVLKAA